MFARYTVSLGLYVLTALALQGCLQAGGGNALPEDGATQEVHVSRSFSDADVRQTIEAMFLSASLPRGLVHRDTLRNFYAARGFEPLWIHEDHFPGRIQSILPWLLQAWEHGLNPEWYHASALRREMMNTMAGSEDVRALHGSLARIELYVSDALLRYNQHLRYGVFDPRMLDASYYLPVHRPGYREFLEPLHSTNILAYLRSIQPVDTRYTALRDALRQWREADNGTHWPRIPAPSVEKISAGDTSSLLPYIAQRLLMTGELPATYARPSPLVSPFTAAALRSYELDSMRLSRLGSLVYDSALVYAVMRYQTRHGLLPDGVLGPRTIARLNKTSGEYVAQMERTLERFRWVRYPERGRYVRVNIPEFWLYGIEDGEVKTDMKVCTGLPRALSYDPSYARMMAKTQQSYDRKNYETPMLHGSLTHLILNPPWYVPSSIGAREVYFSALKDPGFLRRKGYRVYKRDSLVDHSSINWSEYNPRNLPFRFVQSPGDLNALGNIKFIFTNDHSIFLHDTPQQWAFKRATRAVSHGCVRIEKPMEFARFLLEGSRDWTAERVQQAIRSRVHSKPVFLPHKTPLYIDYYTAWVDSNGVLQFRDDVYRKDAMLASAFTAFRRGQSAFR